MSDNGNPEGAPVVSRDEARQGNSRHMNFRVLIWSGSIAAVVLLAMLVYFGVFTPADTAA